VQSLAQEYGIKDAELLHRPASLLLSRNMILCHGFYAVAHKWHSLWHSDVEVK